MLEPPVNTHATAKKQTNLAVATSESSDFCYEIIISLEITMLDAGLLRNIYNTTMRRSSTFGLVIVTGAIVTDMVLDNVVDGFFRGKNANVCIQTRCFTSVKRCCPTQTRIIFSLQHAAPPSPPPLPQPLLHPTSPPSTLLPLHSTLPPFLPSPFLSCLLPHILHLPPNSFSAQTCSFPNPKLTYFCIFFLSRISIRPLTDLLTDLSILPGFFLPSDLFFYTPEIVRQHPGHPCPERCFPGVIPPFHPSIHPSIHSSIHPSIHHPTTNHKPPPPTSFGSPSLPASHSSLSPPSSPSSPLLNLFGWRVVENGSGTRRATGTDDRDTTGCVFDTRKSMPAGERVGFGGDRVLVQPLLLSLCA